MENLEKIKDVMDLVNSNNYYYDGNHFNNYFEMKESVESHFKEITEDSDDQEEYYKMVGLNVGEAYIEKVKVERYFVDEVNTTVTVEFFESYIDSGVPKENYYHAYLIQY